MPYDVQPPEPREDDPLTESGCPDSLDDSAWWPGPVEAEHAPADYEPVLVIEALPTVPAGTHLAA